MKSHNILLVDDDQAFRAVTSSLLEEESYSVTVAENAVKALDILGEQRFDLILSDLMMQGMNGLQFMRELRARDIPSLVIMVTGYSSVNSAVEAMKLGAYDYLTKPCSNEELILKVKKALQSQKEKEELLRLRSEVRERHSAHNLIGKSAAMQEVYDMIERVAQDDVTVLITGETGTGKELAAKALHYSGLRKGGPFIAVNCAALTETLLESELFGHEKGAFSGAVKQKIGRFEMAEGGTLFLDEIGDIPLQTQVKLLRVLQERRFERVGGTESIDVDIRLIAATHVDLNAAIEAGSFRQDLYFRLNVLPIHMPPLRERIKDIPLLADHFLSTIARQKAKPAKTLSPAALHALMTYDWPGNIRELQNIIERAVLLCPADTIEPEHISFQKQRDELSLLQKSASQEMSEAQLSSLYARMILEKVAGNKKEACRILGLNFKTLQKRLET